MLLLMLLLADVGFCLLGMRSKLMPMSMMTPLVLDHDVRQYDVNDSGLLIDVLIYIVYDADVEDVDVVVVCCES